MHNFQDANIYTVPAIANPRARPDNDPIQTLQGGDPVSRNKNKKSPLLPYVEEKKKRPKWGKPRFVDLVPFILIALVLAFIVYYYIALYPEYLKRG